MTGGFRPGNGRTRIAVSVVLAMAALGATATEAVAAAPARPAATSSTSARTAPHRDFDRELVEDLAEAADEEEVRQAAKAALESSDPNAIREFLDRGQAEAHKRAQEKKKATDAENRKKIEAMRGTGGPHFNAEVERVLKAKATAADRESFLEYGADIAREQDAKDERAAKERAAELRRRVEMLATVGGPEVKKAAQAALDAGSDAAVNAFLEKGYLVAAQKDADNQAAREKELKEAQEKADKEAELARKTVVAVGARAKLIEAHDDTVRALREEAHALTSAANAARQADWLLTYGQGDSERLASYDQQRAEVTRQVGYVTFYARAARIGAMQVKIQADCLTDLGMPQEVRWAEVAPGLTAAADAAGKADEAARRALSATADAATLKAKKTPKAYEQQAEQWRADAEQYTKAAAALYAAVEQRTKALNDAAGRAQG
ncbi:hypothetical protein ACH4FX_04175 [Streptomyces sp. NPDC018019]|uniref:hypothetical protein n=1 Tax=Streptomyces sp. NPDC018019 TaxID=3365030 RepID=UPI00379BCF59